MPCYHFTYHGYGMWLPDRDEGFVVREKGEQSPDFELARIYRERMVEGEAIFDEPLQRLLIDELQIAAEKQKLRLHFAATEPTHLHVLVSWGDDARPWDHVRNSVRTSLTRRLNREHGKRRWFSDSASRHRVGNEDHFNYLVGTYLPQHGGWMWSTEKGSFR
jgi:hypothetical protein